MSTHTGRQEEGATNCCPVGRCRRRCFNHTNAAQRICLGKHKFSFSFSWLNAQNATAAARQQDVNKASPVGLKGHFAICLCRLLLPALHLLGPICCCCCSTGDQELAHKPVRLAVPPPLSATPCLPTAHSHCHFQLDELTAKS